jgi:hypothetical protein
VEVERRKFKEALEQCREALTVELNALAQDIAAPGTPLNKLVTGT